MNCPPIWKLLESNGNVHICEGDALDAPDHAIIAHQCNIVTTEAAGFAAAVFKKWPETNTYTQDNITPTVRRLGGLDRKYTPLGGPTVVNMYSQKLPGHATSQKIILERHLLFYRCLEDLLTTCDKEEIIVMPYLIGCGLAGGNWKDYYQIICRVMNSADNHRNVPMYLVKLPYQRMVDKE